MSEKSGYITNNNNRTDPQTFHIDVLCSICAYEWKLAKRRINIFRVLYEYWTILSCHHHHHSTSPSSSTTTMLHTALYSCSSSALRKFLTIALSKLNRNVTHTMLLIGSADGVFVCSVHTRFKAYILAYVFGTTLKTTAHTQGGIFMRWSHSSCEVPHISLFVFFFRLDFFTRICTRFRKSNVLSFYLRVCELVVRRSVHASSITHIHIKALHTSPIHRNVYAI